MKIEKLDKWVEQQGGRAAACEVLGISEPSLSRLINGLQRPSWEVMTKIKHASKGRIRPNDFDVEEVA